MSISSSTPRHCHPTKTTVLLDRSASLLLFKLLMELCLPSMIGQLWPPPCLKPMLLPHHLQMQLRHPRRHLRLHPRLLRVVAVQFVAFVVTDNTMFVTVLNLPPPGLPMPTEPVALVNSRPGSTSAPPTSRFRMWITAVVLGSSAPSADVVRLTELEFTSSVTSTPSIVLRILVLLPLLQLLLLLDLLIRHLPLPLRAI